MLSSITKKGEIESTSAPWVILVINVNISLVGLTLLPSMFQISSTMQWHGLEDVEPLQNAEDKGLAQAQSTRLYIFILVIQDHIESIGKPILLRGDEVLLNGLLAQVLSDMAPKPSATLSIQICPNPIPTRP